MSGLRELGPGLWIHEAPLRFFGVPADRIMNVVRLEDGSLFVHSPAPLDDALRAGLDAIGEVRFVAAPNCIHGHLWMEQYAAAYPRVELLAAPKLRRRRKDLDFAADLGDEPDPRWAAEIDQAPFNGNRLLPELEFFHRPSRTLILGDVAMNFGDHSPRFMRVVARLGLMYDRLRATPVSRMVMNRKVGRRDMERILSWDFERVIPGHGAVLETGGRLALEREWRR